jgi:hypothetical protein
MGLTCCLCNVPGWAQAIEVCHPNAIFSGPCRDCVKNVLADLVVRDPKEIYEDKSYCNLILNNKGIRLHGSL